APFLDYHCSTVFPSPCMRRRLMLILPPKDGTIMFSWIILSKRLPFLKSADLEICDLGR
ncbi:hypothetical protein JI435_413590, partial [Parastagonospora nodorum SN15]